MRCSWIGFRSLSSSLLCVTLAALLFACADARPDQPELDDHGTLEQDQEQSSELDELELPDELTEQADDELDKGSDDEQADVDQDGDQTEQSQPWPACQQALEIPAHLQREALFDAPEYGWERVERWRDSREIYVGDDYVPDGRNDQRTHMRSYFDNPQPPSSLFLLHYAPGWDRASDRSDDVPVLLVHGTASNADHSWSTPNLFGYCGAYFCPGEGLMQFLAARNHRVFAISFAQMQGDNVLWAEQLANAISIIRERTGSPGVDVVAWSKGGFAARILAARLHLSDGGAMAECVRKLVFVGSPHKGLDYPFRYGILPSMGIYTMCLVAANAPSPHTMMTCNYLPYEQPQLTIYVTEEGDFYPGQRQMLYRWDDVYPVSTANMDYLTTYEGGTGFVSVSLGIDHAIAQGSLVEELLQTPLPSQIQTFSLCGSAADIPLVLNESSGPSDGVLLLDSCTTEDGLTRLSEVFVDEELNHFELGWADTAMSRIADWLEQDWE